LVYIGLAVIIATRHVQHSTVAGGRHGRYAHVGFRLKSPKIPPTVTLFRTLAAVIIIVYNYCLGPRTTSRFCQGLKIRL